MFPFLLKAVLSGLLIGLIAEIGKRQPGFAALIASLPLISVIGMLWLYHETMDIERLSTHATATFWYVLPSLPMFLLCPMLWKQGVGFYWGLLIGCVVTIALYFLTRLIVMRFGIVL